MASLIYIRVNDQSLNMNLGMFHIWDEVLQDISAFQPKYRLVSRKAHFWEHKNLSGLSIIWLIWLLLLMPDIQIKHYTCINVIMLFLFAGTVYWNHLRGLLDQSDSMAGQSDTNLDTGTICQFDTNYAMTVVTQ